ncbi:MAG: phage tail length tape measure family protein [Candidatus Paceibacterota bacterium]
MGQIGSMWYNIGAKTADLEKGLASSKSKVSGLKGSFTELNSGLEIARKGFQVLSDVYKVTILEAAEAEKMSAKLNSVLASTGYEAGVSRYELDQYASSLSKVTVNSEETIMNAEALLLTFTKVGKEVFPEALKAAMDMSAAFGQDLNSSIIQVGKALNDPAGMSAMKRIGVSFSDAQIAMAKSMFETGDVAGYQKLIMGELNKEVGGMALAMGTTYAGQVEILKNNISELGEEIGSRNIGDFTAFVVMLNKIASGTQSTSGAMADYLNVIFDGTIMESKKHRANEQELIDLQKLEFANGTAEITGKRLVDGFYVWRDASGSWHRELADGIGTLNEYGETAEEVAKKASDARQFYYESVSGYASNLTDSEAKLLQAEKDLADYIKNNPWDKKGITERKDAVEQLKQEQQDMTNKWMLNVYTQMLTADGDLSKGDMAFLLQFQIDTGMLSEENAKRAQDQYNFLQEVSSYNQQLQDSFDSVHGMNITNTITTIYRTLRQGGTSPSVAKSIAEGVASGEGLRHGDTGYANGADFIVPPGYPNDSYRINVQSGEHVKITPTGASESSSFERQLLNALGSFDPYMNALILSNQLIKSGR